MRAFFSGNFQLFHPFALLVGDINSAFDLADASKGSYLAHRTEGGNSGSRRSTCMGVVNLLAVTFWPVGCRKWKGMRGDYERSESAITRDAVKDVRVVPGGWLTRRIDACFIDIPGAGISGVLATLALQSKHRTSTRFCHHVVGGCGDDSDVTGVALFPS